MRFALENVYAKRALLQTIEAPLCRSFYDVPQKTGTLATRTEVVALEDALEFSENFALGQVGPIACLARTPNKGFRRGPHVVPNVIML
jgi:hypothetical protein